MKRSILLAVASLFLIGEQTFAQSYTWQQTSGPAGGIVEALLSIEPQTMLVSVFGTNIYRSTNGGTSWSPIPSMPNFAYGFVASSTGHIYAGGTFGVLGSTDGGATWTAPATSTLNATILSLCVDSSGRVFAGSFSNRGIYRSTDGGVTWTQSVFTATYVYDITATKSGTLLAATSSGIYRSTDAGSTWLLSNNGLLSTDIRAIVSSSTLVFAGTSGSGVYRSDDAGITWVRMITGLTSQNVYALTLGAFGQLFAGTLNGVYRSVDNSNNWSLMVNSGMISYANHLVANSSGTLLAGNSYGVFRSTDLGNNWARNNTSFKGGYVSVVAANANGYIFAGADGIYRSSDLGTTWTSFGPQNEFTYLLATTASSAVYAGTSSAVYRSTDDGGTWVTTPVVFPQILAVSPGGTVFAGNSNAMLRSTNAGVSWDSINTGLPKATRRAIAITATGVVYVSVSGSGIYRSSNSGTSWTRVNLDPETLCLYCSPSGSVFAGTNGSGMFRSTDNGQNWTDLNTGLNSAYVYGVFSDSKGGAFATTDGLYQMTATGTSWTYVSQVVTSLVSGVTVSKDGTVILGTLGSGVYRGTLIASAVEDHSTLPLAFAVEQNYPNPFNPSTMISYQLATAGRVMLKVFNSIGQEVAVLVNEQKDAGTYSVRWDAQGVPSGIYFYRLQAGDRLETRKMVYVR
jgi:ligand-binding sensor domain-containing protein